MKTDSAKFLLRAVEDSDHTWLVDLHNDPVVLRNVTNPKSITLEQHLKWWSGIDHLIEQRKIFTIDGIPAGFCKFYKIDTVNMNCTLGADLHAEFRGRGLAKEMWKLMLEYCFHTLALHRVNLTTADYNMPAQKVYRGLGFLDEGRFVQSLHRDGKYFDQILMYKLRT